MNYCEGGNPEKGQTFDLPESIKKTVKNRICVLINKIKLIKIPLKAGLILSKE